MTERDFLIDQLDREIGGEPWHGPSLANIVDGMSAEQAAFKPSPEAHSAWEILLHMTGWKREVARRARGQKAGEPPEGDWPAVGDVSDARWAEARNDHVRAHRELVELIRSLSDERLEARVEGDAAAPIGARVSVKATLYGLLQHDVYHSGQLALLKKVGGGVIRYGL